MENLQKTREELEKRLKRKEETHYKKPFWFKENEYQNSVRELREIYDELFEVALKLGDPIPVWF